MSTHLTTGAGGRRRSRPPLADLLTRGELRDPRIGYITITGVKVSPGPAGGEGLLLDARHRRRARGDPEGAGRRQGLRAPRGDLAVKLRVSPEVFFAFDESVGEGDKIDRLLRR